jgi:hypothetical protein
VRTGVPLRSRPESCHGVALGGRRTDLDTSRRFYRWAYPGASYSRLVDGMKFDRIILSMVASDVQAVLSIAFRDHLVCECVDHRDVDAHCDHLADIAIEVLEYDGSDELADFVLKEGKYAP